MAVAACLLAGASAYGQATRTIRFPDGSIRVETVSELEAEIDADFEPTATPSRSGKLAVSLKPDSTNALSASEAQSLVSKAMSMDFQRNAYSFYRVMEEQRQRGGAGSAADVFNVSVTMGDWERVGKLLARMPSNSAAQVYSRMLAGLAKNSKTQQSLFKRYEGVRPVTEAPEPVDPNVQQEISYSYRSSSSDSLSGVFLTDDFFGVVEAAPGPVSADDLRALAHLAKVSLTGESGQRMLGERLKAGMKNFRENVPAECANAARLLCSLGWTHMAEPYLPATAREASNASAEDALLAAEFFAAKGMAENDVKTKERAWGLMVEAAKKGSDPQMIADRVLTYAPGLDADFVRAALPSLLTNAPALEQPLFERLAKMAAVSPDRSSSEERASSGMARALRVQALLMEGLTASGADTRSRTDLFNGLIWNWLNAAEQARMAAEQQAQQQARENFYGRQVYGSQRTAVSSADVLAAAPGEVVVGKLGRGLARQVRMMKFALMLLEFDEPRARAYLDVCCAAHPEDARELASNFLTAWVDKRSSALAKEDPELARMRAQNPYYAQQMQAQSAARPGGIPLTRARQNKNIAELKSLLVELRKLSPLDPARVTWAFINIHSGAEVYRDEDIEAIFGPAEKMERGEVRMLIAAMRVNLARGWRDMEAQTKAGTQRSEQDVKDEVSRGYGVALNLVRRGLGTEGGEWEDNITRGQLYFDASEFERDRNIKLADYINLRDAAFASFKQATVKYGATLQSRPRGQWTIAPYQSWFFVLLGASDLAALTTRQARNDLGLQGLRESLAALPGEAADAHIRMFAATLTNLLERVPSQMKQKFLAAGVQVVGENSPYAVPAQNVLAYYANLTDEAQLRLTIDGPTRVGHGRPFGAFVTLEHTKQLAREGGGFSKYLQNQAAQMSAMYGGGYVPPGQRPVDYKSNFETNLYAALGAQFDIVSVTFADPAVKPVDIAREGWQAMPLAYVVLKAKDPAVDRIPSIQLDVDFSDQKGTVVLPILSQVLPVNCADKEIASRPCANLALAMTLDTREWRGNGKLTFEIAAMGNGIIPPLKELCTVDVEGLETEIKDTGLNIATFGGDKGAPQPQASRSWQIVYLAKKGAPAPAAFRFPQLAKDFSSAKVDYKRYVDADLETITPASALAGVALPTSRLSGMNRWLWGAGALVFVIANLIFLRRWGRPAKPSAPKVALPSDFSPFAVVAFLRRIVSEHAAKMNEADRAALLSDIRSIEAAHFAAQPAANAPDLRSLAERWQRRAL